MKEITWREFRGLSKQRIVEGLPVRIRGLGVLVSEKEYVGEEVLEVEVVKKAVGLSEADRKKVGSRGEYNGLPTTWKISGDGLRLVEWYDELPEGLASRVIVHKGDEYSGYRAGADPELDRALDGRD